MKAVVLEIKGKEAAVLKEDGTVVKIRRECSVGETIELEENTKKIILHPVMKRLAVAAAAFVIVSAASGGYFYTTVQAASYVTVDTESSIEYVLNRRNQVVSVNALDEEGDAIKAQMEEDGFGRCSLTEAMERTKEARKKLGEEDTGDAAEMIISVTSDSDERREAITSELISWIDENLESEETGLPEILEGVMEDRDAANEEGVSTGKYLKENRKPAETEDISEAPEEAPALPETGTQEIPQDASPAMQESEEQSFPGKEEPVISEEGVPENAADIQEGQMPEMPSAESPDNITDAPEEGVQTGGPESMPAP